MTTLELHPPSSTNYLVTEFSNRTATINQLMDHLAQVYPHLEQRTIIFNDEYTTIWQLLTELQNEIVHLSHNPSCTAATMKLYCKLFRKWSKKITNLKSALEEDEHIVYDQVGQRDYSILTHKIDHMLAHLEHLIEMNQTQIIKAEHVKQMDNTIQSYVATSSDNNSNYENRQARIHAVLDEPYKCDPENVATFESQTKTYMNDYKTSYKQLSKIVAMYICATKQYGQVDDLFQRMSLQHADFEAKSDDLIEWLSTIQTDCRFVFLRTYIGHRLTMVQKLYQSVQKKYISQRLYAADDKITLAQQRLSRLSEQINEYDHLKTMLLPSTLEHYSKQASELNSTVAVYLGQKKANYTHVKRISDLGKKYDNLSQEMTVIQNTTCANIHALIHNMTLGCVSLYVLHPALLHESMLLNYLSKPVYKRILQFLHNLKEDDKGVFIYLEEDEQGGKIKQELVVFHVHMTDVMPVGYHVIGYGGYLWTGKQNDDLDEVML